MSLSRRALFRGAAAAGMTAATGGAGKVAQGAVTAGGSAAVMVASLSKAKGIYDSLILAGKQNFFDKINSVFDDLTVALEPQNQQEKDHFYASLQGGGDFQRHASDLDIVAHGMSFDLADKIKFDQQNALLKLVEQLPPDVPVIDLLSSELYQIAMVSADGSDNESGVLSFNRVKKIKEFLEPLCSEHTTADDLKSVCKNYFVRLARHAQLHPGDFYSMANKRGGSNEVVFDTAIDRLHNLLANMHGDGDHELAEIVDNLRQVSETLKKDVLPWHAERIKLEDVANKEKMRELLDSYKNKDSNNENADSSSECENEDAFFSVFVRQTSETEFVVDQTCKKIPSRKDWFNWMRTIDPEDAKICDVKTSHGGFAVTLQNQIAIDFLNARTDETRTAVVVDFTSNNSAVTQIDHSPA